MCSDKPCLSTTLMTTTATIKRMEILGGRDKGNSIVSRGDVRGWLRKMLNNSASNQLFSPCYIIAITSSALALLLVCDKIHADDDSLFHKNTLSLISGWTWGRNCSVISDMFNLIILKHLATKFGFHRAFASAKELIRILYYNAIYLIIQGTRSLLCVSMVMRNIQISNIHQMFPHFLFI